MEEFTNNRENIKKLRHLTFVYGAPCRTVSHLILCLFQFDGETGTGTKSVLQAQQFQATLLPTDDAVAELRQVEGPEADL